MFFRTLVLGFTTLLLTVSVNAQQLPRYVEAANHPAQLPVAATAHGTVNFIDTAERTVNISHSPIEPLGWPAMTMDFPVSASLDLSKIRPGSRVTFTIERDASDGYTVTAVNPDSHAENGGEK